MSASRIYYVFVALATFGLGCSVTAYVPFLLSIGLHLSEVALINSLFWLTIILMELPTGMVADGRSRSFSIKAGIVFKCLGSACYMAAVGLWSSVLAEAVIATAFAFFSGAEQAWVADALKKEGRGNDLQKVFANATVVRGIMMILGGFVGLGLSLISFRLIWLPIILTGFFNLWFVHKKMNGQGEPEVRITEIEAFKESLKMLRSNAHLRWVLIGSISFGIVLTFNHYWTPYFEPMVGRMGLGWVWVFLYVPFILSGVIVRRIGFDGARETTGILLALFLTGLGLMAIPEFAFLPLALGAVVVHEVGRGMFTPLENSFIHSRVESSYRATFGSLHSFIGKFGFAIMPFLVWIFMSGKPDNQESISLVWLMAGSVMFIWILIMIAFKPKRVI